MAEEEKKQEAVEEKAEEKKEKKPNWFSKTWNKMKTDIDNSSRENKIESTWRKTEGVNEYTIYTGVGLGSSKTIYGKFDEEKMEVLAFSALKDEDIPYSSVLSTNPENPDKELPKRYYVVGLKTEGVSVDVEIEEEDPSDKDKKVKNTYNRPATIISLDKDVKEVEVIKVKDTYYIKQKKA